MDFDQKKMNEVACKVGDVLDELGKVEQLIVLQGVMATVIFPTKDTEKQRDEYIKALYSLNKATVENIVMTTDNKAVKVADVNIEGIINERRI